MIRDIRIGFTAGVGPVSWAIRRLDRAYLDGGRTAPSRINHVLLRVIYAAGPDLIFQAHGGKGVGVSFTAKLCRAIHAGTVKRYAEKSLELDHAARLRVEARITQIDGCGYDYWRIALYYLAFRFGYRRHGDGVEHRYTCNEAVCMALDGLIPWIRDDGSQTPERLFAAAFKCPSPIYFEGRPAIGMGL